MADPNVVYHYTKTRAQRGKKFIAMGLMCLAYIALMFGYENYQGQPLPEDFKAIGIGAFSISALVLFAIALWHHSHPARFEAIVTHQRLIVRYPGSSQWSFDIAIDDIKRFEYRQTLSHAGKGITDHGVLLNDGQFHHISMNYDLNLKTLHQQLQKVRPDIPFPNTVNTQVEGPLSRPYRD